MDKNIAALLREDARTIRVTFELNKFDKLDIARNDTRGETLYNYVTHLQVAVGDYVCVEAAGQHKVVEVVHVDDGVKIEPSAEYELRWVIAKVDFSEHEANMQRNDQILQVVAEAYQANLRRSFAQQILSGVSDEQRASLTALLK